MNDIIDASVLTDNERRLWRMTLDSAPPARHSARSAVRHILRSALIAPLAPEIALFCAICAEEEAVTAVFHALRRKGYEGAPSLNWRNHRHKAAALPFINAMADSFKQVEAPHPDVIIQPTDNGDRVQVRFRLRAPNGTEVFAYPKPALGMVFRVDDVIHDFGPEVRSIVTASQAASIGTFLRNRANERNELLYGGPKGVVSVQGDVSKDLESRRAVIFSLVTLFLVIDQSDEQHALVQQALAAFIRVMELVPQDTGEVAT